MTALTNVAYGLNSFQVFFPVVQTVCLGIKVMVAAGESIERSCGVNVVCANLLEDGEKVRHDPNKLADVNMSIAKATAGPAGL
jgi:hypothetical protein